VSASTIEVPDHVRALTAVEKTSLADLAGSPLVAISSVKFNHLDPDATDPMRRYEALRYLASLAATRAYANAGVPQIVMFDQDSDYRVPQGFAQNGAIVVPTPRPGLARPYLDAAQLVRLHAGPNASALKAEADKLIDTVSLAQIAKMLEDGSDVLVGDRTAESMATLAAIQHFTEALIDTLVPAVLDVPHGASCGVQAYSPDGLEAFLAYEHYLPVLGDNWKYLISTPALAAQRGLSVSSVPVMVSYDAAMVAAENNPAIIFKRLEQLAVMLEGAIEIADVLGFSNPEHSPPDTDRRKLAGEALSQLSTLMAAASTSA
jgi:hypothetical protein